MQATQRNWSAYNDALTSEGLLFENLQWDLLQAIPEPPYAGNGRPRQCLRSLLFVAISRAYTGLSSRRHQGLVEKAVENGLLPEAPHFNAVSRLMRDKDTKFVLQRLVELSALPLRDMETSFAADSTGFATRFYGTYREAKHGREGKRKREWVKLHAICGVKTNIVTAAIALDGHSADSPRLEKLVARTSNGFRIHEVSADKAYSSKANHWWVRHYGGTAYIPFRGGSNTPEYSPSGKFYAGASGKPGSARIWRKAYHFFKMHEDAFYERYHKRSNIESTFGAIKQRFSDRLKSKDLEAQCNEVLCKVVAWNICVVVRAIKENEVSPGFLAI